MTSQEPLEAAQTLNCRVETPNQVVGAGVPQMLQEDRLGLHLHGGRPFELRLARYHLAPGSHDGRQQVAHVRPRVFVRLHLQ